MEVLFVVLGPVKASLFDGFASRISEPPQVRGGVGEPIPMGDTPQDLLRFLPRNPKGVLLRYGEAKRRVGRVEPNSSLRVEEEIIVRWF